MLRLASCLLIATATLAAHSGSRHRHDNHGVYPIDYDDDFTIRNPMVQPDSNIVFSFAQTRQDQPPQVDVREEKLGRYMYQPKQTTTSSTTTTSTKITTPKPTTIPESEESSESVESIEVRAASEPVRQRLSSLPEKPEMLMTGTTSKPVIRGFHDFSLAIPDSKHINPAVRYPAVNIWPQKNPTSSPLTPVKNLVTLNDLLNQFSHPHNTESKSEKSSEDNGPIVVIDETTVATQSPSTDGTTVPTTAHTDRHRHRRPHSSDHSGRGSHKFSWDDLKLPEVPAVPIPVPVAPAPALVSASVPFSARGPPPPVPTLSPWVGDNFGK